MIFVSLYHIIVTYVSFWLWVVPPFGIMLARDIFWLLLFLWFLITHISYIKKFILQWSNVILLMLFLLVVSLVTSVLIWADLSHIAVWIKYSLYYFVPFVTALFIGWVWGNTFVESDMKYWLYKIWQLFIAILLLWWIWQITKNIAPDIMTYIWYGPLWDYIYWNNPPLYYLTWPKWFQRWSGIFSWPNNYWYLLVAFFGLFWYGIRAYVTSFGLKITLWSLFIVTLAATMSRWAILWVLVQVVLIAYVMYYAKRKMILLAVIAWMLAVGWLSLMKWQSTVAHIKAKFTSLQYVQQAPLWLWLWSSWPSVHSQWWYLPENYFVQLMMDLWLHGFILWWIIWIFVFVVIRRIYLEKPSFRNILFFVSMWFVWLMIEGLFLHVLEDSMVNYLYFIVRGIVVWYVANQQKLFKSQSA